MDGYKRGKTGKNSLSLFPPREAPKRGVAYDTLERYKLNHAPHVVASLDCRF